MPSFLCNDDSMKNTHLEHPEDMILNGKDAVRNVINFLKERNSTVSTKYDGSPALVFGTNPENGKTFVGTKSVFNKKKIKINYTHADIEKNHGNNPKVAGILHTCLAHFPQIDGVYQADFIGYGGQTKFTPNTITYDFSEVPNILDKSLVLAAHTTYVGDTMKELQASFCVPEFLCHPFLSIHFVDTRAQFTSRRRRIDYILGLANVLSNFVQYPTLKEVPDLKIAINKCIREGRPVDAISGNLLLLFNLLTQAKLLLMEGITTQEPVKCSIAGEHSAHEGYVVSNQFGTYKLVNRAVFSYNNFVLPKDW